ncbi:unnamed protein product, partial [Brenthis ino]
MRVRVCACHGCRGSVPSARAAPVWRAPWRRRAPWCRRRPQSRARRRPTRTCTRAPTPTSARSGPWSCAPRRPRCRRAWPAQPLPRATTIPAQPAAPRDPSPEDEPLPLATDVLIPAQLSTCPLRLSFEDTAPSTRPAEIGREDTSLPKLNRAPDDIQPVARSRIKKSPTTKSVSDSAASDISVKSIVSDEREIESIIEKEPLKVRVELETPVEPVSKDERLRKDLVISSERNIEYQRPDEKDKPSLKSSKPTGLAASEAEKIKNIQYEIKTEEQAWDMLLNEPEKLEKCNKDEKPNKDPLRSFSENKTEELKIKSKKNRKPKKSEEQQAKEDEDSFVEIHTIEDKQQTLSDDLVSISTPLEDANLASSYLAKSRKRRSSKSRTPERKENIEEPKTSETKYDKNNDIISMCKPKTKIKDESLCDDVKVFTHCVSRDVKETLKETKHKESVIKETQSKILIEPKATTSFSSKESPKSIKSKSSSPKLDFRKTEKSCEIEEKEVYVINTNEEDFPEIQITRANKSHKKSPLMPEKKSHDTGKIEMPVKSWSSIAAAKNVKMVEEKNIVETVESVVKDDNQDAATVLENNKKSEVSLQEKLMELCKRRDIMVAECDAPTELNFVEEHHAVMQELPPLEPLDFGLDDFKMEVMRDSLLETSDPKVASPICKINIDDILSSIKETTTKVIESSTFNLIDIEKVPTRKERGFNVVESDKITSQEVKLDDEMKLDKEELEKSSDDDIASPVLSTDSDKEDKKSGEASNSNMPLSKQSKSKKSRRKKK